MVGMLATISIKIRMFLTYVLPTITNNVKRSKRQHECPASVSLASNRLPPGRSRASPLPRTRRGADHPGVGPDRGATEVSNTSVPYTTHHSPYTTTSLIHTQGKLVH